MWQIEAKDPKWRLFINMSYIGFESLNNYGVVKVTIKISWVKTRMSSNNSWWKNVANGEIFVAFLKKIDDYSIMAVENTIRPNAFKLMHSKAKNNFKMPFLMEFGVFIAIFIRKNNSPLSYPLPFEAWSTERKRLYFELFLDVFRCFCQCGWHIISYVFINEVILVELSQFHK